MRNKGEQQCRYKLVHWNNKGSFDIFNDISYHVTLVQLRDTDENDNHTVSITVSWIYYSNYKRALTFIKESLISICSPSKDEKCMYAKFKDVFYDVGYENPLA